METPVCSFQYFPRVFSQRLMSQNLLGAVPLRLHFQPQQQSAAVGQWVFLSKS
jgi:hypothetical protein